MGLSFGKLRRRRRRHDHDDDHHHQSLPSTATTPPINQISPLPPSNTINTNTNPNSNSTPHNSLIPPHSYSTHLNTTPNSNSILQLPPPPPPQQPPSFAFAAHAPYFPQPPPPPAFAAFPYASGNHFAPQPRPDWTAGVSSGRAGNWYPLAGPVNVPGPPAFVDHSRAKKVKNDVNVRKDSIRLVVDERDLDSYLVSFTFDALVDGSITITYFAKEEKNCKFIPSYPEICTPRKIPFSKGLGQKFCQPSGTGIDLGFFELEHLSKPSPGEDIFPLVICAEASISSNDQPLPAMCHAQITQAVLVKNNEGRFEVKVAKQILWIDGVRYELREIYGIGNSENVSGVDDKESGKECVICITEPKDTAVLPCRHMCLCSECAKELRLQSNKCPICRQPIEELMEIKLNKDNPFL